MILKVGLTVWEQLQLLALTHVERLQVAEISEAFGHHQNNS